ncbi:hypothetical protein FRC00_001315 [Tulasnella sp. 408]|nr:hypothetical protein FRC00_001315 [Tulasnella sp. 408]
MAAADALWRIYIKPESPGSPSVAHDAGILRPKEIGKIKTTPTFRQLHDTIRYSLVARVLDCWRIVIQRGKPECQDLAKFAKSKPGWDFIVELSIVIAKEFVAGHDFARKTQGMPADERDYVQENAMLWLRHALLYTELSHAMNHGDIGRIEDALKSLVFLFDGCGKHKYSVQLSRFLISLNKVYPPRLARAIRMNWLVNPSGKPDGFRAVDWQVELNNFYTKVVHGGAASNHTIGLIRKRSILIDLYRSCHVVIERNFSLPFNSTWHAPPDMTKTLENLCQDLQSSSIHITKFGRGKEKETHKIEDAELKGMNSLLGKKKMEEAEIGEENIPLEEIGPQGIDDLGIEG